MLDNQLYCNCQLFWLKEAFEMNPENRNYNNKQRCYIGQGQYSNDLTIVQFLMDNLTIEQCTLPLPPTSIPKREKSLNKRNLQYILMIIKMMK